MTGLILLLFCFLSPPAVTTQQTEGWLDLESDAREQIERLESRLRSGSDESAQTQVVWLQWLIELYGVVGDKDGAERCYRQILAYFPYDVGTMNAYARFLIESGNGYGTAEELLRGAASWGRYVDVRSLDLGTTYELLARVELERGDVESAIIQAQRALELLSDEFSTGVLRVLAEGYLQSGDFDAAADVYLELIGLERGINQEDINALELFINKTSRYNRGSATSLIKNVIEEKKERLRARIELEGANLVSLHTGDGVVLEGTLRRTDGAGAVLFVPDLGSTRSVFSPFAQLLFTEEISTLSIDPRGHGGSRSDSLSSFGDLPPAHVRRIPEDIAAGFEFLKQKTGLEDSRIVIVAEGRACEMVEKAMHTESLAAPVVHLSPVFSPDDRELKNAFFFHADRPILVVFSAEDLQALQSFEEYRAVKDFPGLEFKMLKNAGHGADMLRRDQGALEFFQNWVRGTLGKQ